MAEKNSRRNETTDALFDAILSLESREECYAFFEDLCTVKEISDMAQRLQAAKLLLDGATYEQIVKAVEISTATIRMFYSSLSWRSLRRWRSAPPPSAASTAAFSTAPAATVIPSRRCAHRRKSSNSHTCRSIG